MPRSSPAAVAHAPGHATQQLGMRYLAEVIGQIRVHHLPVAGVQQPMHVPDCVQRAAPRPIGAWLRLPVGLEDRCQHERCRRLRDSIPHARYAQRSVLPGLLLGNQHLPHRLRAVGAGLQVPRQFPEPLPHAAPRSRRPSPRPLRQPRRSGARPTKRPARRPADPPPWTLKSICESAIQADHRDLHLGLLLIGAPHRVGRTSHEAVTAYIRSGRNLGPRSAVIPNTWMLRKLPFA